MKDDLTIKNSKTQALHLVTRKDHSLLALVFPTPLLVRVGGVVTFSLVSSTPDRTVWVRALAGLHCVVFLGKTLDSHSASLLPGV